MAMPDRVGHALAEWSGRGLDSGGVAVLGVARGEAAPRAERLRGRSSSRPYPLQEELEVEGEARVPHRQDEPVAPDPVRGRWGRVAGGAGTAGRRPGPGSSPCQGVRSRRVLHGVHGQDPTGVDGAAVEVGPDRSSECGAVTTGASVAVRGRWSQGDSRGLSDGGHGGAGGGRGSVHRWVRRDTDEPTGIRVDVDARPVGAPLKSDRHAKRYL